MGIEIIYKCDIEKFAVISSLTTEKWDTIISAFKKMKSEGVDINSFRPGEEYNICLLETILKNFVNYVAQAN